MKPNATLQNKLAKQNEINRQRLAQELVKLEKVEKSDLRMIETARHRFRSRHKNLESRQPSFGSNAVNVRMYDTHNPGFCYHCTGAIKECSGTTKKKEIPKDSYEFVRSIVFTRDEIDADKLLCLHLLTAHSTKWNDNDGTTVRPVTPLLERAKNKHFSGAWNNLIPCYVVDTVPVSVNVKLHEDPRKKMLEDQTIREFEDKYKQYMEKNTDYGKALSSNAKYTRQMLHGFEKMPCISPHVYSLLGASHELRIKQALAEGVAKRRYDRSRMELNEIDENSLSFHLDDDDDLLSRATTNVSTRNWVTRSTRSPSRRSTIGSTFKLDHGITMLKSKRRKNYDIMPRDLVTIKSSFRAMKEAPSKTSSTKSPFCSMFGSRPSTNSLLSATFSPEVESKKFRKRIYLNAPIKSIELRNKEYTVVPILVNYQLQALVQAVFEVLQRVNPEKSKRIIDTARDTDEIKKMLLRPEIQSFVQYLLGQSLISSPESFVISVATMADEIDLRFEGILEKEIIALTLEMPSLPCLDALVTEIRNNIFLDTGKKSGGSRNIEVIAPVVSGEREIEEEKNTGTALNVLHVDNKSKKLKYDEKFPRGNKNKSNHKGVDTVASKSNEDNVMQVSEIKYGRSLRKNSKIKGAEQSRASGNVLAKRTSNFKCWKAAQDLGHLDANHVILQRMTNTQRILVGQMCASLKTKRINNQGLINESVPLAALIAPALSRDSIKFLTRGTVYSNMNTINEQEDMEDNVTVSDKLTGPLLAKVITLALFFSTRT
ncbi:hypothetical protein WH47_02090 [Habropoda laboriosa]|uniref:Uncharacterized protein n=1 Tax=Habropoda laboriosa TaxID=597456 RepID=A0A0L7RJ13_9HYME|nr:hypothetical protein WH47_02090 [Habropoda laboriosa]